MRKSKKFPLTIFFLLSMGVISFATPVCPPLKSKKVTSYKLYLGMPVSELVKKGFYKFRTDEAGLIADYVLTGLEKYDMIVCSAYKDRIFRIGLFFKDKSIENFNLIKRILIRKYGNISYTQNVNGKKHFLWDINVEGKRVFVILIRDLSGNTLAVSYIYKCVQDLVNREIDKARTNALKNEL